MMWIVDADTLIDQIKDMSILIDGYIETSDDYVRTVKCSECEYLKVHNTKALYAFCPKFGIEFYPFENDTRKHGCSWGKPKGKTLVEADRKTENKSDIPTGSTGYKMEQVEDEQTEDEYITELIKKKCETEPQTCGEWVWTNERKNQHKCSVCGEIAYSYYDELADNVEELFDYCPYCGAKMSLRNLGTISIDDLNRRVNNAHREADIMAEITWQSLKTEPQTERSRE